MPKLIPTTADNDTMARYVQNIKDRVNGATPDQVSRGVNWYPNANNLAYIVGHGNVRMGAGLIASLSVNKGWGENKRLAVDAGNGIVHGHMRHVLEKTRAILAGNDPMTILPADSKTWNFYRAILDPKDPDTVVIDRHVHDAIVGQVYGSANRGLSNKTRYATLAYAVRVAARDLGMIPNDVQSILWITQIDMVRGKGSRHKRQGE